MSDDACRNASGGYYNYDYEDGECKWSEETNYNIDDDMMCARGAGRDAKKKDACKGDSGGSFTVKEHGKHSLAGVVSWAYGCASVRFNPTNSIKSIKLPQQFPVIFAHFPSN